MCTWNPDFSCVIVLGESIFQKVVKVTEIWGGASSATTNVLGGRDTRIVHTGGRSREDAVKHLLFASQELYQHLHFGLLVSRPARKYMCPWYSVMVDE